MASRTFSGGFDIGLGRRGGDSSSSRESSPGPRKRKRSFSPGSDDGDADIPPIADDDTPPPVERPIIRQAVGFGGATAVAPPTASVYQASIPAPTGNIVFLPGQAPVVPKKSTTKRKKNNDAFKSQSGRFRLDTYDSTPSEAPPMQLGVGPYSSTFRGFPDQRPIRAESPASNQPTRYPSTSASTLHSEGSASPAPQRAGRTSTTNRASGSRSRTAHSRASRSETPAQLGIASTSQLPTPITDHGLSPTSSSSSTTRQTHYRRDYDTGQRLLEPPQIAAPLPPMMGVTTHQAHQPPLDFNLPEEGSVVPLFSSTLPQDQTTEATDGGPKARKHGAKMVLILVQDIRSGVVDNQLVEVQVPIRIADVPTEGYWADAKELMEQWQKGPARVDGPARVYTLRGKYRQILLRVSATNVDDFASANVSLKPDKTVEVVVENLPTPGVPPPPPQLPSALVGFDHNPTDVDIVAANTYPGLPSPKRSQPQKLPAVDNTPSERNSDHEYSEDDSPYPQPTHTARVISSPIQAASAPTPSTTTTLDQRTSKMAVTPAPAETTGQMHARARLKLQKKPYDSPASGDEPDKKEETIRKAVDHLIQKDDQEKWKGFFKLKGRVETASNMVARYRFVQDLFDKYVGEPVPFRSTRKYIIKEKHILAALIIEDSDGKFVSNCRETLDLLALYGKDGKRCEDPDVLKLMEEKDLAYNAKPIKRLLHLLRDVDKKWLQDHPPS